MNHRNRKDAEFLQRKLFCDLSGNFAAIGKRCVTLLSPCSAMNEIKLLC
jgi:hypothetical protein